MFKRKIKNSFYYRVTKYLYKRKFSHIGEKSVIISPLSLDNVKSISIGNCVNIHDYAWLMGGDNSHSLIIGDGTTIGHYAHIIAKNSVEIGEKVLIADKVFITDCTHNYEDINIPIIDQGIHEIKPVKIGNNSWIGENVCIIGASIGEHCVVAANAVVVNDVPDYCVAAGAPAKIIKKYDFKINIWKRISSECEVI